MKKLAAALALTFAAFSAHAGVELVTNGNFETGNFTGWTKSGNNSLSDIISNNVTSNTTYVWRSGATGSPAVISQTLQTQAGMLYTLSFDVFNTATTGTFFSADFGGNVVANWSNQQYNWTHFTFTDLVGTGTSTLLSFSARNDPSFIRLDNVSVVASAATSVPEPTSLLLLGAGVLMLGAARRRSKA